MMTDHPKENFRFAISLSVLNHLGRNLYRNFITVLGEAISNAWDADARNVWIDINRENDVFSIKDDGCGMDREDFQGKFLKIGYSKRAGGVFRTGKSRPFIGSKGIGKLALLSCAGRISVFSKTSGADYIGGVIDNTGLDEAITKDMEPDEYPLEELDHGLIANLKVSHDQGTIIVFQDAKDGIRNTIEYIRKIIAMSFRFSLIDEDFSIHVNGSKVTISDLQDLMDNTEFLWLLNQHDDEYLTGLESLKNTAISLESSIEIRGFLATVEKPSHLKIRGTSERATLDLFVNGRLREKNILGRIPTQRIIESYLYGQIHFNQMDRSENDPFTSSREGIMENDSDFQSLLDYLKRDAIPRIIDDWDRLRLERGKEGDEENIERKSKKERRARNLYSAVREEYEPDSDASEKDQVADWLDDLQREAEFNLPSYVHCFLSENLVRKYISKFDLTLKSDAESKVNKWRKSEKMAKEKANIGFDIRKDNDDLSYLTLEDLSKAAENYQHSSKNTSLFKDSTRYKPIRDVVGHTGLLTSTAKSDLNTTFENIKSRVKNLISRNAESMEESE